MLLWLIAPELAVLRKKIANMEHELWLDTHDRLTAKSSSAPGRGGSVSSAEKISGKSSTASATGTPRRSLFGSIWHD